MSNSHFIWIFKAFHAHQTATFWAVLAPTILRSGVVRLLTWCRLAGFSYVVRPFARSRHPLMLSGYFFYTHTISVHQYFKELLLQSFPNLSRCKIVAARTTYFIRSWTYLCTVRDTHETELVRECDLGEARTHAPVIRNQPALSTELLSHFGAD